MVARSTTENLEPVLVEKEQSRCCHTPIPSLKRRLSGLPECWGSETSGFQQLGTAVHEGRQVSIQALSPALPACLTGQSDRTPASEPLFLVLAQRDVASPNGDSCRGCLRIYAQKRSRIRWVRQDSRTPGTHGVPFLRWTIIRSIPGTNFSKASFPWSTPAWQLLSPAALRASYCFPAPAAVKVAACFRRILPGVHAP